MSESDDGVVAAVAMVGGAITMSFQSNPNNIQISLTSRVDHDSPGNMGFSGFSTIRIIHDGDTVVLPARAIFEACERVALRYIDQVDREQKGVVE